MTWYSKEIKSYIEEATFYIKEIASYSEEMTVCIAEINKRFCLFAQLRT